MIFQQQRANGIMVECMGMVNTLMNKEEPGLVSFTMAMDQDLNIIFRTILLLPI